ncbi:MAG: electron transfer flavoprotein subunit beta/FixA family protein [Chloroflexi bacterium]|nr:MAG: electron transfer flavoprotein subunit beta/FixA family protein [Chloroflexota bacterium]
MNIVVPVKLVPDLVEELEIDESGTALDTTWLRLILNEFDDHAIEQAILLKERSGGQVTVVAPDVEDVDDVLYTAAAKGADRLIKLVDDFEAGMNNHALARLLTPLVKDLQPDLVLTGVQAHNDLDGPVGPLLAGYLGLPYVGYVAGVTTRDGKVTVRKEYPGGLSAEMEVTLPAVLGIQAAEEPPRYVAFSKVRQAMKTATIEELPAPELDLSGGPTVGRMFQPEVGERATMIEGDEEEVATKLVELFKELGVL